MTLLPITREKRPVVLLWMIVTLALFGVLLAPAVSAAPEPGTPLVVNSTGTANDNNMGDGICDTGGTNAAGQPECTLQAAIRETNLSSADHIHFNIPTSDPGYSGSRWRISLNSTLPSIGNDTEVEGNTQPGFAGSPVIEIHNAGNAATGLRFSNANGGSVEYLSIINFDSHGIELSNADNMRIAHNHVGVTALQNAGGNGGNGIHLLGDSDNNVIANNTIGLNSGHGIAITGGSENTSIDGNFIGTIRGENMRNAGDGIHITSGSHDTTIGATSSNVVSGNGDDGIHLDSVQRTEVYNNTIGLLYSRRNRVPNSGHGIHLTSGAAATIGSAAAPNTISGNLLSGVAVINSSANIVGNFIGTNPNGKSNLGNRQSGVVVVDAGTGTNVIGNAIQNNTADGVTVRSQTVFISQNSMLGNGDQEIDLNADGFSPNDAGDNDGGRNDTLNFPEIANVSNGASGTNVTLDLDVPSGSYTIELFEYEPFQGESFRDTDHVVRSFPFTSNGSAVTRNFGGFTATPGNILSATLINSGRGITSEVAPTVVVPAAAASNRAPVLAPIPDQRIDEGEFISFATTATDPDGDAITYSAIGLPAGFTINANTGVISGTAPFSSSNSDMMALATTTVIANDGSQSDTQTFDWEIDDVPQSQGTTSTSSTTTTTTTPTTGTATPTTTQPSPTDTGDTPGTGAPQSATSSTVAPAALPFRPETTPDNTDSPTGATTTGPTVAPSQPDATDPSAAQSDTAEPDVSETNASDQNAADSESTNDFDGALAFDATEPPQAGELASPSLAVSAATLIEEREPELASFDGLTIRSQRIVGDLVDIRLSAFQLSSLSLAPILLAGLYLALRRQPRLVAINRVALDHSIAQQLISDEAGSLKHDQVLWSTNHTRTVKNRPETLVEMPGGDRIWVPTANIIDTGY